MTEHIGSGALRKRQCLLKAIFRNPQAEDCWRRFSDEEYERYCRGETKSFGEHMDRADARLAQRFYDALSPRMQEYARELFPLAPTGQRQAA